MLRKLALFIVGVALLAGLGWRYATHWGPGRTAFPTQGIDVSQQQGAIDWKAVRSAGVDFAYIRASQGSDMRDERFAANWSESAAAEVKRGAYHVFNLCKPGREQATNFIALVPREAAALPHALDLEFDGNCAARPPRQALIKELALFIQMAEAHSEKPMILYMTREFDDAYKISEAIDRPLWLRRAGLEPSYGGRPWVMWQANPKRHVDGIEGNVDWDVVRPQ